MGRTSCMKTNFQEDDLTGKEPQDNLTNLQESKLGQLVWLVKVAMSLAQLSPSLFQYYS